MDNVTLTWIVGITVPALILTVAWLFRTVRTEQNDRIAANEKEMKHMKENYLDRFDKVNTHIVEVNTHVTASKEEIIAKLHQLELSIGTDKAAQLIERTAIAVALALKEKRYNKK